MKIDSHQHFWIYSKEEYDWIDDSMKVLQHDFLPKNLEVELEKCGFHGSIAVQARQTIEETRWLLELADQNPKILGVVGWVDICSPDLESQLEVFTKNPKLVGVRHVVQGEPDDRFMLREDFIKGLKLVEQYQLAYDILIFPRHLPVAVQLVEQFPNMQFILDHIAKPLIKDNIIEPWAQDIKALAKFSNVYCKLSGLVTEANWETWTDADLYPYIEVIHRAFGVERILLGSDWPVCTLAGSYQKVMSIGTSYFDRCGDDEKELIYCKNAIKAYHLNV
jgi:L-fuconolactonase